MYRIGDTIRFTREEIVDCWAETYAIQQRTGRESREQFEERVLAWRKEQEDLETKALTRETAYRERMQGHQN